MILPSIDPLTPVTTAFTDAVYVINAAVAGGLRRRLEQRLVSAAAFANHQLHVGWAYVLFAAIGSWIAGSVDHRAQSHPAAGKD